MFRLHGDGRDQARAHCYRAVSGPLLSVAAPCVNKASVLTSSFCLQVQEAHGLQEEETAAAD